MPWTKQKYLKYQRKRRPNTSSSLFNVCIESIQSVDNDINKNENENENKRPVSRQFPDGRSENMNDPLKFAIPWSMDAFHRF